MKNIYLLIIASLTLLSSCLDVDPVSDITDKNYWKTQEHFDAFVYGLHNRLRKDHLWNIFLMGEGRSDIYGDQPFGGEATQGMERFPYNTLNVENVGLSNYAGLYSNINQLNLFLSKIASTSVLSDEQKSFYTGQAHGLRAFYFFHLYRTWGAAVYTEEPSLAFEIGGLDKAADSAEEIMKHIKEDIKKSEEAFGTNYKFVISGKDAGKERSTLWSKAATLMLKSEVYLWTAQADNSTQDATTALAALNEIKTNVQGIALQDNFVDVFDYNKKRNKEIIFGISHKYNEANLFNDRYRNGMLPSQIYLDKYLNEDGTAIDTKIENNFGLMRFQIKTTNFQKFDIKDTRRDATVKGVYDNVNGVLTLVGTYPKKYPGYINGATRVACDDYPIYRYAELILMEAEAKLLLGQDITAEINAIRKRAYGANYSAAVAYPNQVGDNDKKEVILKERFFEFMVEGKRWYDLRRFGNDYVFKYTLADKTKPLRLLWPIDKGTLNKNTLLNQTLGYE